MWVGRRYCRATDKCFRNADGNYPFTKRSTVVATPILQCDRRVKENGDEPFQSLASSVKRVTVSKLDIGGVVMA